MHQIISEHIDQIKSLCISHNVKSLYAFGSVCTNRFNDDSDIDFLIAFKPMDFVEYADTYFDLADEFETLLHRSVDLVTDKSLKNPYFIENLNKTKTLLYEC